MSRIQLNSKAIQAFFDEFTLSVFPKTNKLLTDKKYSDFVSDMIFRLGYQYSNIIDFVVCEVFGTRFKNAFYSYEKKKGPPLRECPWFNNWMRLQIDTIMCELISGGYKAFIASTAYESIIVVWRSVVKTNEEYKAYGLRKTVHNNETQPTKTKEGQSTKRRIKIG